MSWPGKRMTDVSYRLAEYSSEERKHDFTNLQKTVDFFFLNHTRLPVENTVG